MFQSGQVELHLPVTQARSVKLGSVSYRHLGRFATAHSAFQRVWQALDCFEPEHPKLVLLKYRNVSPSPLVSLVESFMEQAGPSSLAWMNHLLQGLLLSTSVQR